MIKISVRISDEQAAKINKAGGNISEYTRRAIEFYSEQKDGAVSLSKVSVIDDCIKMLEDYKKEIQQNVQNLAYNNFMNDVGQNDEKCRTNVSDKNEENVGLSDKNEENVGQSVGQNTEEVSDIFDENVRQMKLDLLYPTYEPYLQLMSKMLNLHNSIPEPTKKKITAETCTKMEKLNHFLFSYHDEIKNIDWSISDEIVHVDYEDGQKHKK